MGIKATRLFCNDCQVPFTVHTKRVNRSRYFCPLCGENMNTRIHIHSKHPLSEARGTRPRWSDEDKEKLIRLFNTTNYTYKDLAFELGRNESSIRQILDRLRKGGKL